MPDPVESGGTGFTATIPPANVPDKLKMSADFPEPPQPPPEPAAASTPPPLPQKFTREIDLKDGSGAQKFEAETWEGLVDKLAVAQENATRKIRELSRPQITPEKTVNRPKLSDAEMLALKEGFTADPLSAFNKMFEAQTGISAEQFRTEREQKQAEMAFLNKHKAEYYACPENAHKINDLLNKEELPVTARNLEYAFYHVQGELTKAPVMEPAAVVPTLPPPPVPPRPGTRDIPPPPVMIPANFGERVANPTGLEGLSATELAQIAQLSPAEMKARIELEFRKQRGTVR